MRWKSDDYCGWGRALTATGDRARPERMRAVTAEAPAQGNRRSYGDAPLNSGGKITDMTRLDRICAFDPATGLIEVEAGCTIATLARVFAPQGWLPAVMPGTGFATVGGCIANDVHGKNHHHVGSFGQHVTEITLLNGAGKQVITPASGAIWAATIGGLGQTGIIQRATLQMIPVKGDVMMVTERRAEGWAEHLSLLDNSRATYCVGWIDATATGDALGRGIVEEAEVAAGLVPKPKPSKKVPIDAPGFALSSPIVRAFNQLYYRRVPALGRSSVKPIDDFFFPLDKIHDWNRLYGKRGFHQFQCVVPVAQAPALRDMMALIAGSGLASPLAVLKRMGDGRGGMLSFPMEGYTLAVDFPNRAAAAPLIDKLIDMTAAADGRIYFAKDSLARPDHIAPMYPQLADWRSAVADADPAGTYETDLTRRLTLRTSQ